MPAPITNPKDITDAYDAWYRELLSRGKLPLRSTALGFWGAIPSEALLDLFQVIKIGRFTTFCDLGSGDGKVVLLAALKGLHAEGVECDEELHTIAVRMKQRFWIQNAAFHLKDYYKHSIAPYDLVFLNPDQSPHHGLTDKLEKELHGHLIVFGAHFHPANLNKQHAFTVGDYPVAHYIHHRRQPKNMHLIDSTIPARPLLL